MKNNTSCALVGAALLMVSACTSVSPLAANAPAAAPVAAPTPTPAPTPKAASPAVSALALVSLRVDGSTEQGGHVDGFAYAEKDGDARFDGVQVSDGVARVTGQLGAKKGSSWGGIGFVASLAADDKPQNLSTRRVLVLRLASASARSLRVRLLGPDKATRDNGCYPVFVQPVTPELAEYRIALDRFAPESYCGAQARSVGVTLPAVAAVEVTDPAMAASVRAVDFRVGAVSVQ